MKTLSRKIVTPFAQGSTDKATPSRRVWGRTIRLYSHFVGITRDTQPTQPLKARNTRNSGGLGSRSCAYLPAVHCLCANYVCVCVFECLWAEHNFVLSRVGRREKSYRFTSPPTSSSPLLSPLAKSLWSCVDVYIVFVPGRCFTPGLRFLLCA